MAKTKQAKLSKETRPSILLPPPFHKKSSVGVSRVNAQHTNQLTPPTIPTKWRLIL